MSGNLAGAGSAIAGGWTGAAGGAAAAAGSAAASAAANTAASTAAGTTTATSNIGAGIWGNLGNTAATTGATTASNAAALGEITAAANGAMSGTLPTAVINATGGAASAGVTGTAVAGGAGAAGGAGTAASTLTPVAQLPAATQAVTSGGGLLGGLSAGEAMLWSTGINAGTQLIGGAVQGRAAEKEAEEARKRMTYWGVDGEGNAADLNIGGLLKNINLSPMASIPQAGTYEQQPWQPQTLDDLTDRVG